MALMLIGAERTNWNGLVLPLDLSVLGLPRCDWYVAGDVSQALNSTAGSAQIGLAIPFDPSLRGVSVLLQAMIVETTPSVAPSAITGAVRCILGA